ncbi:undecaprenyl-diphosphate phosphatase [Natrinema longum]|uniref:Undecaprenyl-diphosphatase n=1 Tax=Natrinema longum TaxID=370324 RepID=A0A8A2UAA9_9EURY|nr:undecaprenyl-diphosphate phosphatase [Natrinema longum]MBZ6496458.1 undecaprenyl-diphosphate phosphatase [Natrinema longum]QSW85636.1 undecaprenyl-diphosphate phosphatase [Natrinema longum]
MNRAELVVAILAGIVQGVVEWLPVSSQGNLALFLTAVGTDPSVALQLALFLQLGTTLSAATYYRRDIATAVRSVPGWRPHRAYASENAIASYIVVASLMTGLVGIPLYVYAVDLAGRLTGGVFIAAIGVLLILTGVLQLASESVSMGVRDAPTLLDSVLVGAVQGVAILPGISRSGVTTSTLLFRSYDPPAAFRLSFLLSIPASLGAAALTVAGAGGLPGIALGPALAALGISAVVGYLTIDALMRVVDRVPFWVVCFGLGALAIVGGGVVTVVV